MTRKGDTEELVGVSATVTAYGVAELDEEVTAGFGVFEGSRQRNHHLEGGDSDIARPNGGKGIGSPTGGEIVAGSNRQRKLGSAGEGFVESRIELQLRNGHTTHGDERIIGIDALRLHGVVHVVGIDRDILILYVATGNGQRVRLSPHSPRQKQCREQGQDL
mgnify:CR=1 FL=1